MNDDMILKHFVDSLRLLLLVINYNYPDHFPFYLPFFFIFHNPFEEGDECNLFQ